MTGDSDHSQPTARRRLRLDLREEVVDPSPLPATASVRPLTPGDAEALAVLMDDAYRGTIDAEPGQGLDDARDEIAATIAGRYGVLMPGVSLLAFDGDELVSACLVTRFEDAPFVAFTMTRAARKGQGLSRAVMTRSIRAMAEAGEPRVDLIVTAGNDPAERLYASLGFVPVEAAG
jgi:ribosomal protein S18 acetylase RimI-like enzyme